MAETDHEYFSQFVDTDPFLEELKLKLCVKLILVKEI